jgi:hypothetical protein
VQACNKGHFAVDRPPWAVAFRSKGISKLTALSTWTERDVQPTEPAALSRYFHQAITVMETLRNRSTSTEEEAHDHHSFEPCIEEPLFELYRLAATLSA